MSVAVQCPGCGRRFPIGETSAQIEAVREHVALHEQFRELNPSSHDSGTPNPEPAEESITLPNGVPVMLPVHLRPRESVAFGYGLHSGRAGILRLRATGEAQYDGGMHEVTITESELRRLLTW